MSVALAENYIARREQESQNYFHTIRNLPPGTLITEPDGPLLRQLFHELIQLPEDVSPLLWLETDKSDAAALIALGLSLDAASGLLGLEDKMKSFNPPYYGCPDDIRPL